MSKLGSTRNNNGIELLIGDGTFVVETPLISTVHPVTNCA